MMDTALMMDPDTFRKAVDQAHRQLLTVDHRGGASFVKLPILYPSGSTVVIRVTDAHPQFFVTDNGAGYDEADFMGGSSIYSRYAKPIAENAGVSFDSHAFFVLEATREQLPAAIVTVANCSQQAAALTAYKLAERKFSDDTDELYQRLVRVFPQRKVAKDVEIVGQSNTRWHVATLVTGPRAVIFEPVSKHHSSVFAATTKFHDIAQAEEAPERVAVVRRKEDFKTYLAVLSQAANVIERDVPDETIQRLAA